LAIALGILVYSTSRATVDCLSSLNSKREVLEAGKPEAETAERVQSPAQPVGASSPGRPDATTRVPALEAGTADLKPEPVSQHQANVPPTARSESPLPPASPVGSPSQTQSPQARRSFPPATQSPIGRGLKACTSEVLHWLTAGCGRIADRVAATWRESWTDCAGWFVAIDRAAHAEGLVLRNPAKSGGTVVYVLDGHVHSLWPGEKQDLPQGRSWKIQFHRGGDFGSADYSLGSGTYTFHATARGWDLLQSGHAPAPIARDNTNLRPGGD